MGGLHWARAQLLNCYEGTVDQATDCRDHTELTSTEKLRTQGGRVLKKIEVVKKKQKTETKIKTNETKL